jgi:hypothetical protein
LQASFTCSGTSRGLDFLNAKSFRSTLALSPFLLQQRLSKLEQPNAIPLAKLSNDHTDFA